MIGVPKSHRIKKRLSVVVAKLECPTRTRISSFVDARGRSIADAQDIGSLLINRIDVAEVQGVPGHGYFLPRRAAILGAQDGAAGTAGPGDASANRTHATKSRCHAAGLQRPLRRRDSQ